MHCPISLSFTLLLFKIIICRSLQIALFLCKICKFNCESSVSLSVLLQVIYCGQRKYSAPSNNSMGNRTLIEKLQEFRLVKIFFYVYWTRRFITTLDPVLNQFNQARPAMSYFFHTYFIILLPVKSWSPKQPNHFGLRSKICYLSVTSLRAIWPVHLFVLDSTTVIIMGKR